MEWSAPIARWYWTVERDINPYADRLQMGRVNAAIGYPAGSEDGRRCETFQAAIAYLSGQPAPVVDCSRTPTLAGDTTGLTRAQFDALANPRGPGRFVAQPVVASTQLVSGVR